LGKKHKARLKIPRVHSALPLHHTPGEQEIHVRCGEFVVKEPCVLAQFSKGLAIHILLATAVGSKGLVYSITLRGNRLGIQSLN
jgi:hypothetical protein